MVCSVQESVNVRDKPIHDIDVELKHHFGMWTAIWRGWNNPGLGVMDRDKQNAIDGLMRLIAAKRKE